MAEDEIDNKFRRIIPQNNLEVEIMTTNPVWGMKEVNPELIKRLKKMMDESKAEDLWSLLSFYTRDMRLGNLDRFQQSYCEYWLNLASDCLEAKFTEPFVMCMTRVASVLELSQSRGGFLRKRQSTLTKEEFTGNIDQPKKGFFNRKQDNYGVYGGR